MKVTVVGAGAVGASCAEYIAIKNFASEVVLVDIIDNFAEGKAMDLMQTAALNGFDTKITGSTNDYTHVFLVSDKPFGKAISVCHPA